ncbi:DM13 domain-containing protein [Spirillospora sp. NPDC050679]
MTGLLGKTWVRAVLVLVVVLGAIAAYLTQPWRLFIDRSVNEAAPVAGAGAAGGAAKGTETLASGSFVSHEHGTRGQVKIVRLPDGGRVLRIEDLDTSDGPDVRVWLSDQPVKEGRAGWGVFDDGAHVELGRLKGNKGDQNYTIPAGADLAKLTSVTLWCKRFHVSFGAAALRA